MIRNASRSDAQAIADIYNYYIEHTVVTFEEEKVTADEIIQRIAKVQASGHLWLVKEVNQQLVGYAYSTKWRERTAYRFACEVSVYLSPDHQGKGIGTNLYQALFEQLNNMSIKTVIGGITLPNDASIALHEKFGLHQVAKFERVGYKFGQWLDTGYWQKQLTSE
ncbi:hypothetical phosphinothricin N-acetyltransferase [Thalassotalea insulae]|uniref:Hypothetical phosphinothricin N-acetyltransferase n=1 Tax=Thalassotalea insulae TaxID=2056778 RepID=A0ABQ6H132_9GAMM|nr:GNAT family N-acetyltransferase [Thalassotalea insulae]GLX80522.1 hypothetical phosphinothricin N-acetyltransferase [Thalassotalea insulae]